MQQSPALRVDLVEPAVPPPDQACRFRRGGRPAEGKPPVARRFCAIVSQPTANPRRMARHGSPSTAKSPRSKCVLPSRTGMPDSHTRHRDRRTSVSGERERLICAHLVQKSPSGPPKGWVARTIDIWDQLPSVQAWISSAEGPLGLRPRLKGADASRHWA